MIKLRMENITIASIVFSLVIYLLDSAIVQGKTLDPIYWTSSNPMFRSGTGPGYIDAAINDKLDIICPRSGKGDGEKLFYFKLFLVSEDNFRNCNTTGGRRLITCDRPDAEKKYTFYFQEISPSPWGLEFDPNKSYYIISTSNGRNDGMDGRKGGVCTRFNMRIGMKIHKAVDEDDDTNVMVPPVIKPTPSIVVPVENKPEKPQADPPVYNSPPKQPDASVSNSNQGNTVMIVDNPPDNSEPEDQVSGNGLVIGIALGACAVLFIVLLSFLGYKMYRRRRHNKKYQSPPITPTRGSTPLQQVTLLPIAPHTHHSHSHHGRLNSDHERHRTATLSSHSDMRPPPSYNESFLDNGGPVVAV